MKLHTIALAAALLATTGATTAYAQGFSDKDKSFLKDISQDNMAEIKTAELVIKTTKNPQIKSFAEKMVTDHRALLAGAKPIAAEAAVKPPMTDGLDADADYLKLKVQTGNEFDKTYVKTMVTDHQSDLQKIKEEHDSTSNPEMKKLTAHAGTVVAGHLKMIDALAGSMGVQ